MAHKKELDYMNGVGCLLVILIHVLSVGISTVDRSSWLAAAVYLPWRLAACAVPMFFYTGAVKMALQFEDAALSPKIYFRYVLRRFTKIYLPYAAWAVVYYLYFLNIHYVQGGVRKFLSYLLLGNLSAPFYYVVVVMQFYLLLPLWVWMLRHVPAYLAVGIGLLARLCMLQLPAVLAGFGINFAYTNRLFPTFLIFWVAGLYVGKYYDAFTLTTRVRSTLVICTVGVAVYGWLSLRGFVTGKALFDLDQIKIFTDLMSILLLHAAALKLAESENRLTRLLSGIHRASFSVFLSHCLFLTIVTVNLENAGVTKLSVLLPARFLTCYTLPFLLYCAFRWITAAGSSRRRPKSP